MLAEVNRTPSSYRVNIASPLSDCDRGQEDQPNRGPSDMAFESGKLAQEPVSSFYGSGSQLCWFLIVTAVAVSWYHDPRARFGFGTDFAAAIAYPAIALLHLLWQLVTFPQDKMAYLSANLSNLVIGQGARGPVTADFDIFGNQGAIDEPGSGTYDSYPKVLALNAALRVSDNMFFFGFWALVVMVYCGYEGYQPQDWHKTRCTAFVLLLGLGLSTLAQLILVIRAADTRTLLIGVYSCLLRIPLLPVSFFVAYLLCLILIPPYKIIRFGVSVQRESHSAAEVLEVTKRKLKALFAHGKSEPTTRQLLTQMLWYISWAAFAIFLGICCAHAIYVAFPAQLFFPETGLSPYDLDQLAAVLGGLVPLGFNLYRARESGDNKKAK